ncbi:flagellar hook-length control protein FliK [Sinirhodobacter sp. WL0062]|uniref:Flagellar hook-length control protein FliK n=1 Tax=Rhodobacter flavimaris TaxID=2907145 RepID=A0ABS8Z281_9RHOB|nr:flagellar hook-length control protein FliK [Sinirhodobacter sp. WL0062]MCE5974045.1 flagellar hook-length control protein FliK [Sinirhodobacter sp. WL0062]
MPHFTPADRPVAGVPLAASLGGKAKGLGLPDGAFGSLLEGEAEPAAPRQDESAKMDGPRPESLTCAAFALPLPAMPDPVAPGEGAHAEALTQVSPPSYGAALETSDPAPADPPVEGPPESRNSVARKTDPLGPVMAPMLPAETADSTCTATPVVGSGPQLAGFPLPAAVLNAAATAAPVALATATAFGATAAPGSTHRAARDPAPPSERSSAPEVAPGSVHAEAPGLLSAPGLTETSPRKAPDPPAADASGDEETSPSPASVTPEVRRDTGPAASPPMPAPAVMAGDAPRDTESPEALAEVAAPATRGPGFEVQAVTLPPRSAAAEAPATPVQVSRQLAEAVGEQREGAVEVALAPEELGKVKLRLQAHDGVMNVSIQAERAETLDLMRRHADLLAREFRDLGFRDVAFSFADHSGQRSAPPPDPDEGADAPAIEPARPMPIPLKPSAAGRGLDLRM